MAKSTAMVRIIAESPVYSCDTTVKEPKAQATLRTILRCYKYYFKRHTHVDRDWKGRKCSFSVPDCKLKITTEKITA